MNHIENFLKFFPNFNYFIYDKCFPIRKINIKPKRILSTWIRDDIVKSIFKAIKTQIQEKNFNRKNMTNAKKR